MTIIIAKHRHSRSAAALKPAWGAGFNAAALREWRFFDLGSGGAGGRKWRLDDGWTRPTTDRGDLQVPIPKQMRIPHFFVGTDSNTAQK